MTGRTAALAFLTIKGNRQFPQNCFIILLPVGLILKVSCMNQSVALGKVQSFKGVLPRLSFPKWWLSLLQDVMFLQSGRVGIRLRFARLPSISSQVSAVKWLVQIFPWTNGLMSRHYCCPASVHLTRWSPFALFLCFHQPPQHHQFPPLGHRGTLLSLLRHR